MEELVKKFIDSLIEQAKTEAAKLAKQKESEGHIPRMRVIKSFINGIAIVLDDDDEFAVEYEINKRGEII